MFDDYNEFDIALALYHWLQHNWNGVNDVLYISFCQLTEPGMYRPSPSERSYDNITEEAITIYNELTRENHEQALARVLNYNS